MGNSSMKIMRTPKYVDIGITNRCNLRCRYCSHFTSASDVTEDLPTQEWLRFFEELNLCAVMKVTLEGGEPFCREDIKEVIAGIVKNRMRFRILSNGTLITDEIAAFLASTWRCDDVQVSIDGSRPATHDTMRGVGTFRKAVDGIEKLRKHNVKVTVRVTIHKENLNDLERIAEFLLEEIGLPSFGTNAACYMGLCRKNKEVVSLEAEERSLAMKKLLDLNRRYNNRIGGMAGPLAEARNWAGMERSRRENRESIPGRGYLTGCRGPMKTIGVRADGIIVPCTQLCNIELGRINKDDLKEIWQSHPELEKMRGRYAIPLSKFEFCRDCSYMHYCTGNCPALAYTMLGDPYHPSPDACLKRFLEAGGRLPNEELSVTQDKAC